MKASDTLIQPWEVIMLSQSTDHSYAAERCAFIPDIEEELFNKCFGFGFYQSLLADRIKYVPQGSAPDPDTVEYVNYVRTTAYTTGDIIHHEGKIYEVIQDTDGTQVISDRRYFTVAPKFTNDKYQFIWERYLGRLLAFSVTNTSVMYRLIKDTARGLVKQYDEGASRPATVNEVMALKQEAAFDVERTKANLDAYIQRNAASFPGYKTGVDDCNGCDDQAGFLPNLGFNTEDKNDQRYV